MADYIEREAAYALSKKICDAIRSREYHPATFGHLILDWIDDLPAADVAPVKHGRWISDGPGKRFGTVVRLDKDGCPVDTCHCSECGEWLTASDEYPVIGYYCPNCGAQMD